jgi:Putative phage tail protein
VGALLAPHPRGPQPSALGDFSVPTAEEGRAIPVVYGTCMIKGGNTVWWGDLRTKAIKQGGGILSFGRTQTIGYKYFLGCQFMLCHGPVDALVDIQADAKHVPYTPSVVSNGDGSENFIQVNATGTNLFGGTVPGGGGGISGTIDFYRGLQTQQPDDYLSAKQGRIVLDQSGIGYTYSGVGNGTITSLSAGTNSLDETFTIKAAGIDTNPLHSTFNKMRFTVVGSRSGAQSNITANPEGSHACWADQAFSCSRINILIATGSTQFSIGDTFTVITQHATIAAAYRGLCYAVFKQLYVGTSNYLKPIAFVVRRCPDPLTQGAGVANISGDANPALAVYDLLTNVDYGLGIPGVRIDATSFSTAASTLASEGLGISMQFDTQASADQLIGEILRHCDGLLYTDPATGLWTIVLARGGYDPTTLPVLTVDNVLGTPDFSRGSWSETTNLVNIRYASRSANFTDRSIRAYDPANISVTGEVRPQSIDFKGISSETAAALVAIRVLKTLTYPLSKIKVVTNRTSWQFRPGGLFRFTWVPLGIINQVFRITRIGYGELTDGKITMDAVEDIFGINSVAFVSPPSSGWVNPVGAPVAPAAQELIELPYHIRQDGIHALALCVRGDETTKSFQIWLDEGSGYFFSTEVFGTCPSGLLASPYPAGTPALDSTGFTLALSGLVDIDLIDPVLSSDVVNGKLLALIENEIVSFETPTQNSDGTWTCSTVLRGVMDTVPVDHPAGARVWFISEGAGLTKDAPYGSDLTVTAKLLPQNLVGGFPLSSASSVSVTTRSRFARPYPPGDLTMQGAAYAVRYSLVVGDLVVTWKSRNRLTQTSAGPLVAQDSGDITPEAGTTYTAKVTVGASLVRTVTGIAVETFTYTGEMRVADDPDGTKTVTVQIFSNANSLDSYFPNSLSPVTMTGFGEDFGNYFGGIQQ